ncbi:hypothetical protein F7725_009553 [Dissostichus mawsoni]|uniref:RRM domain-containing protein n=1 Tax=Dissostichus mawsoni TaxID=36200 RepID=A0A7J5XL24_DISMA|nr:hypothetical protein F7725_009553 [Dissostichus mawsoni]
MLSCSPVCPPPPPPPPPQVLNSERVQALEAWLMETDTKLAQVNGQRKYGGPPAVGEPAVPQTPPPPSSSSCVSSLEGHLTPSGSLPCPMALLCELCEAKGVGKPHYDVKLSHTESTGFMFFFYDVSVPGITLDFKGLVMILPGTSAYATLREAHQAVAQQALEAWLMETDTKLAQVNGQRKYGGPPAAVGEPAVPQTPPPPSSSSCVSSLEGHLTPSGSLPCPMALLCELCEAKGVGKPHYDVKLSHTESTGFMFFFYDVSVPGITLDFKGLVMILPGTSAYATLREAHQAVAQQCGTCPPPGSQCEVFISQIPRDTYEDVLIPLFGSVGPLWEFRLMMNFSGQNRGFAYAKYSSPAVVSDAVHLLNGHWLEAGLRLSVLRGMADGVERISLKRAWNSGGVCYSRLLIPLCCFYGQEGACGRDAIEFCKAVGEPAVPQTPPPPSSSSCVSSLEGHLTPSGSLPCPMALLCELCEAKGVGKPHYDVKLSHTESTGFMFFFYDVSVPGITLDFKGVVMILPGTSAYATLREAHQAVAQQVLQKICNN